MDTRLPYLGPRQPCGGTTQLRPGQDVSDAELIATWQMFRNTVGLVDHRLSAALIEGSHQASVFYEALAALAVSTDRMLPMSELAGVIGMSSGGLTKLVDRLVQAGLVDRYHSTTDRRVVYAILTPKGADHEPRSTTGYADELRNDLDRLGPHGLCAIRAVCGEIIKHLSEPIDNTADSVGLASPKEAAHG